ncbi:ADP-ribosylation factor-like protein [Glycomyces sp. A-F 0318]|uniref:leucine-rich repeat domain-containing protein n=1 Tax=Glycomyces amatae TaxID=2881355 RepID=UPI001E4825C1|nr:leucine-rich repeat domain-containing protein [Glycomyces amatae]MCD0443908.1 ADP-ribosylation factor-like protein [Glycomyces amatae]
MLDEAERRIREAKRTGLTELDLSGLDLEALPEELGDLTALRVLNLQSNDLRALPEWIGNLRALTSLDLMGNDLTAVPDSIGNLAALTGLDLKDNRLTVLPESIGNLAALTELDLHSNRLAVLPDSIGNLAALTELDLMDNDLAAVPDSIGNLRALTNLDLMDNDLTELPESIGNLTALASLDLRDNRLAVLPDSIGNLAALTELYLGGNRLTELPGAIGNLTALTELDLDGDRLTELPGAIGDLTALTRLVIRENRLTALPESIGNLTALTELDLHGNRFTEVPEWIGNLTALTGLALDGHGLTTLPEWIGNLTALTELNLHDNRLTAVPESIANLVALEHLDLGGNDLKALPEWIGNLTALTGLVLRDNRLTSLPESIGNLTALVGLDLRDNRLTALPESIGNLTALTELDLHDHRLTELPESIGNLTALTELDLSGNRLASLPDSLGNLTGLLQLKLRENDLETLPESIGNLAALTELDLKENSLAALPETICRLTSLTKLVLWDNRLTSLPESIGDLVALTELDLDENRLTALPETLGGLTALVELQLANNRLTALPESIGDLTALTRLNLGNNRLTALPESIGDLTALAQLDLWDNRLTALPESIGNLAALTELDLDDNRLVMLSERLALIPGLAKVSVDDNPLPPEVKAAEAVGPEGLMAFLKEVLNEGVAVREAKLVLVGEGEVGKSTLLSAMLGERFDPDRSSTHGIEVKSLPLAQGTPDECVLNTWDFGGQPTYRPTHQLFFTAPAVYLVVWKPRHGPGPDLVNEWIELVRRRAGDEVRIHVVATHGGPKDRFAHIDEAGIRRLHGDTIAGFHHVDSSTGAGIEELKTAVQRTAAALPHFTRRLPASWLRFQAELRTTGEPYLDYPEYLRRAEAHGIAEVSAKTLAGVATDLGYWCYYPHIPGLDQVVVLKGDWLSTAVSLVMEDPRTIEDHGLIEHARLNAVWDDPTNPPHLRYPPKVHRILLRLMEEYEISYRVSDEGGDRPPTSLVAQLVDSRTPDLAPWEEYHPGLPVQTRICRFSDASDNFHIPEGLVYRLIVRLHRFSLGRADHAQSLHWTGGLVADHGLHGRALIELGRNQVAVTVKAAFPLYLLNLIVEDIEAHVREFWQGVKVHNLVGCGDSCVDPGRSRRGRWELERLINRRLKGKAEITCPACDEDASIDVLMNGVSASSNPADRMGEAVSETLDAKFAALLDRIHGEGVLTRATIGSEATRVISRGESYLQDILKALNDEAAHGPRLFTLENVRQANSLNPAFVEYRAVLWCEYSRKPLRTLNDDPGSGVYRISVPREWLVKAAPWIKAVGRLLRAMLPVALDGMKLDLGDDQWKALEEQANLTRAAIGGTAETAELLADHVRTDQRLRDDDPPGEQLRTLHALLREQDPDFGGLVRVLDRGRFLWVHPRYVDRFNPGLPEMGGPGER